MFNRLSQIFPVAGSSAGPSDSASSTRTNRSHATTSKGKGKQRASFSSSKSGGPSIQRISDADDEEEEEEQPSDIDDSIVPLSRPQPAYLNYGAYPPPPNVAWRGGRPSHHVVASRIIGRSSSNPGSSTSPARSGSGFIIGNAPSGSGSAPGMYKSSSFKSTHSLRLDHRPSAGSLFHHHQTQPLSPIDERQSSEHRPSPLSTEYPVTVMEADVTDELAQASPARSVASSYFITRPLKRSISQGSTQTFGSTASTPPSIPPIDLRPQFSIPDLRPQLSPYEGRSDRQYHYPGRMASLPTIPGSSRQVTAENDDGEGPPDDGESGGEEGGEVSSLRSGSFVTAPTVYTYASSTRSIMTQDEEGADTDLDLGTNPNSRFHLPHHFSTNVERGSHSATTDSSGRSRSIQSHPSIRSIRSGPSVTESRSSSFISKRWQKDESFSSEHVTLEPSIRVIVKGCEEGGGASRTLFWLGFLLGPWCWLIGGWVTDRGQSPSERAGSGSKKGKGQREGGNDGMGQKEKQRGTSNEKGSPILPLYTSSNADPAPATTTKANRLHLNWNWSSLRIYPLFAPSVEDLSHGLQLKDPEAGVKPGAPKSLQLPLIVRAKDVSQSSQMGVDVMQQQKSGRWVRRCRIAAVVSGLLLLAAFVIALVFALRSRLR
ncbi:hypothetical protein JAAARDRAFT_70539 [Jaapia argillacea MUCL 33604]|uniref:Uncharacterized protein n=1 Tax=Jaapia argillacea MUCL 33604 TaxID=933084 RepID=A0A067PQ10_9AGAM|nr:hypothetical protein JAAARDRAFT_70539 [Jaapia argillacea MUCL 33604]